MATAQVKIKCLYDKKAEQCHFKPGDRVLSTFFYYAFPCLLVDKSDKSPHFCTDYRKVNGVTKPDASGEVGEEKSIY